MSGELRDDEGRPIAGQDQDDIEILEVVGLDEDGAPLAEAPVDENEDVAEAPEGEEEIEIVFEADDEAGDGPSSGAGVAEAHDGEDDQKERILRLRADFENFKNRIERERFEHVRFATADLVGRILPVLDNFERAMVAARPGGLDDGLLAGFSLIQRQLLSCLEAEGLRVMSGVGEAFDPARHEAVATDSQSALPPHTVTHVLQRGYFLHDRVLRPALVRVSVNGGDAERAGDDRKES